MNNLRRIVIGYHGCDQSTYDKMIINKEKFDHSTNDYDWLGSGVYFWQDDPQRAQEFAEEQVKKGKYKQAAVIGAVIDLGNCLNLHTRFCIEILRKSFENLKEIEKLSGYDLPKNSIIDKGGFALSRKLDCAVIENIHKILKGKISYDTVLGIFQESEPVYENAGFSEKTHVQICVRKDEQIIGVFIPNT